MEKLIRMFMFFQTAQDNIDLQTTILSRFDLIFIVKDVRMYSQDKVISNYLAQMKCFTLRCTFASAKRSIISAPHFIFSSNLKYAKKKKKIIIIIINV